MFLSRVNTGKICFTLKNSEKREVEARPASVPVKNSEKGEVEARPASVPPEPLSSSRQQIQEQKLETPTHHPSIILTMAHVETVGSPPI